MTKEVINTAVGFHSSREAGQMAHLYRKKRAVEKIGLAHVIGLVVGQCNCCSVPTFSISHQSFILYLISWCAASKCRNVKNFSI